jgi:hypothetical protein
MAVSVHLRAGFGAKCEGDAADVTHPLHARLLLLAAAAALAASLVFAMIVAEARDVDARAGSASVPPVRAEGLRPEGLLAAPVPVALRQATP